MATLAIPSESIELSNPPSGDLSSSSQHDAGIDNGIQDRKGKGRVQSREEHRILAACVGAIVTSLTMTPFDVIKTRLQTQNQAESLFIPSSHVPPPSTSIPVNSSASRLKGNGRITSSASTVSPMQHARSLAATNLATCCQKTYFTTNLTDKENILCRFDPREAAMSDVHSSPYDLTSASRRISIPTTPSLSTIMGNGSASITLHSSEACHYPTPASAAQHLPQLSLPSSRHFAGFFDAFSKIVQYEGLSTLWRGLSASLLMSVPSQAIYMVGYDSLRSSALERAPMRFVSDTTQQPNRYYIATTAFLSGSASRTAVAVLLAPLELFRTRLQSTGSDVSLRVVLQSVQDLVRNEGSRSLWRGLSATLWRDVPFSGTYWTCYEVFRRLLTGGKGMGEVVHGQKAGKTFGISFASGACAGMVASALTHPFDVVKTRRQTEAANQSGRGTLALLNRILEHEGMPGLWRGLVPRVAKVAPACGIMIGAYEFGLRWAGEEQV